MPYVQKRWFSGFVSQDDGSVLGAFSSCGKQPMTSCSRMSGFRGKQREAAETIADELPSTACVQKTTFVRCEAWMETFTLEGVSVTPASFLLNLKPKKQNQEEYPSEVLHGALCLYSFKTKEYVYHRYDHCLFAKCFFFFYVHFSLSSIEYYCAIFNILPKFPFFFYWKLFIMNMIMYFSKVDTNDSSPDL